jgi:hypothetical protein
MNLLLAARENRVLIAVKFQKSFATFLRKFHRFKTIKPGSYPADVNYTLPPHIHFGIAGKKSRLVPQMFFQEKH